LLYQHIPIFLYCQAFFQKIFFRAAWMRRILPGFSVFISPNVPAVCDVPARPVKQTAGLRAGWNVPE
jgi:hypothetical protein